MRAHIDFLDAAIAQTQVEIEQHLAPYHDAVRLLQTILASTRRRLPPS
ncbi:MAG TPA: hypothetical protein VGS80_04275 [Ktedonobacterales bacterium]|nr:hypothetical protein [Ktedonobacterales bacterium]